MKRVLMVTSRPRKLGGETSAMYTGTVMEARPAGKNQSKRETSVQAQSSVHLPMLG